MSKIINIDKLLPDGIVFNVGEERYRVAGDIKASTAFKIMELGKRIDSAVETENAEAYIEANQEMHDYLLELFQVDRPELTELPWSFDVLNRIAGIITARAMGMGEDDLVSMGDNAPTPPKRPRQPSRTSPTPRATKR